MTTAVLKNRLLDLTGRAFDEAAYGATSFMDFVLRNKETLAVDHSTVPPLVELRNAASSRQPSDEAVDVKAPHRIRPDLWKAALDYSSGTRYVWDVARRSGAHCQITEAEESVRNSSVINMRRNCIAACIFGT